MSLWDKVKSGVSKAGSEAQKQTTIARLNIQLGEERVAHRRKVAELGEAALQLCRAGTISEESLLSIYREIESQETKIKEVEGQIAHANESSTA